MLESNKVTSTFIVAKEHEDVRADIFLADKIKRLSRSKIQELIKNGDFWLKTGILKAAHKLQSGEEIFLTRNIPDLELKSAKSQVSVIFEDDNLLVINKPGDLAVHPSAKYLYQTLTHWLKETYPQNLPRPCHRLDRETSGVLLCAKNKHTDSTIKKLFIAGKINKSYLAIVEGHLNVDLDLNYKLALQENRGLVRIKVIEDTNGLASQTLVTPLKYDSNTNRTLVKCNPKTGRQHQIRAHLSMAGFGIVGDKLYSMGEEFFDLFTKNQADLNLLPHERQALHAHSIEFEHEGVLKKFDIALPDDLKLLGNF